MVQCSIHGSIISLRNFVVKQFLMSLQYVSDNSGHTTAVLIPIDDWNQLRQKHPDIDSLDGDLPQWQKAIINERMLLLKNEPNQVTSLEDFLKEL